MGIKLVGLLFLALTLWGCDENDPNFPEVQVEISVTASPGVDPHGTIQVSPSPYPPFEIKFKEDVPLPTPLP